MYDDGNGQTYKKEKFQPKPQEPKVFKAMGFFKREVSEVAPKTQNDQNVKNLQVSLLLRNRSGSQRTNSIF